MILRRKTEIKINIRTKIKLKLQQELLKLLVVKTK